MSESLWLLAYYSRNKPFFFSNLQHCFNYVISLSSVLPEQILMMLKFRYLPWIEPRVLHKEYIPQTKPRALVNSWSLSHNLYFLFILLISEVLLFILPGSPSPLKFLHWVTLPTLLISVIQWWLQISCFSHHLLSFIPNFPIYMRNLQLQNRADTSHVHVLNIWSTIFLPFPLYPSQDLILFHFSE